MRAQLIHLNCLLSLLIASSASAVAMDWTPVGNPGNACDPMLQGCFGAVPYSYNIGTYEVTNAQYAEFLNAVGADDSGDMRGLYNSSMGITQTVTASAGYNYSAVAGRESRPVTFVSFFDAVRFANWMNNGQASGDTETGAYTLLGGGETPINGDTVTRNAGATIFLPNTDEWYKAGYYNAATMSYFDYPAGSDVPPVCATPSATPNLANCGNAVGDVTNVGSYTGSASPDGTFDQGGNVAEWEETIVLTQYFLDRGLEGGDAVNGPYWLSSSSVGNASYPGTELDDTGFRLAMIPEPGTGLFVMAGLLGLTGWRRSGLALGAARARGRPPAR